ncbi:MAG: hypothetical protein V4543_15825 [Bacteroidota bacterium]
MEKRNPHLTYFDDHLDVRYGKRGTPKREEYEIGFEEFMRSIIKEQSDNPNESGTILPTE